MGIKYLLHVINEIISKVCHLRDLAYTYKHKEIITSILKIILDEKA
jgi:hypothetical protein